MYGDNSGGAAESSQNDDEDQEYLDDDESLDNAESQDELMDSSQDFETHSVDSIKSSSSGEDDSGAAAEGFRKREEDVYDLAAECISDASAESADIAEEVEETVDGGGPNDWHQNMHNYLGYYQGENVTHRPAAADSSQTAMLPPPPDLAWRLQEPKAGQSTEDEEENARIITAMIGSRKVQSARDWCNEHSESSEDSESSVDSSEVSSERVHIPLDPGAVLADLDMELHLREVRQPFEQRICELENELENLTREAVMLGADTLSRQAAATLQPATEEARRERLRPRRNPRLEEAYTSYTQEAYRQYQKISAQAMASS